MEIDWHDIVEAYSKLNKIQIKRRMLEIDDELNHLKKRMNIASRKKVFLMCFYENQEEVNHE